MLHIHQLKTGADSCRGAATALSEKCLKDSWVVYGVAWDENFQGAHYERISSVNELKALSGTKYVQARKGKIYSKVKKKFGCWRKSYFLWLAL